jgi:hypothetical protein
MSTRLFITSAVLLSASSAAADHDHAVAHDGGGSVFGAGVSMVAASYETMLYVGNYQGVQPSLTWASKRLSLGASAALYRIERNGASYYGLGDLVVHGQAPLVRREHVRAGVIIGAALPVGDEQHGLGMGHVMLMPAGYATYAVERIAVTATAGYGRALGGTTEHDHGMSPIVEPMNFSEVTWSAAVEYAITDDLHGGGRFSGGVPVGNGDHRVVGALRLGWAGERFTTGAELQAGITGDPFTLRGVVSTALAF